jgi:hypothetical protein
MADLIREYWSVGAVVGVLGLGLAVLLKEVVRPTFEFALRALERRQERKIRLGLKMREMIEERIEDSLRLDRAGFGLYAQRTINDRKVFEFAHKPLTQTAMDEVRLISETPHSKWEPYRIESRKLRRTAEELSRLVFEGRQSLIAIMAGQDPEESLAPLRATSERRRLLSQEASRMMDKFGWVPPNGNTQKEQ